MIESPCINVCVINKDHGLCEGCYRTLEEIARWGALSDVERRTIIRQLERRKLDAKVE